MLWLPARGESEARRVLSRLAAWERRGFRFEGAEASFELMLRSVAGRRRSYFRVLGYRVVDVQHEGRAFTEATVEVEVGGERIHSAAMGVGPVNALDRALHAALGPRYPELADLRVVQSRTRNLSSRVGSAGPVRVVLESADGRDHFGTAGVSDNFLQAVCQALADAAEYRLAKDDVAPKGRKRRV
jgi:2-isopropylmalate synthase